VQRRSKILTTLALATISLSVAACVVPHWVTSEAKSSTFNIVFYFGLSVTCYTVDALTVSACFERKGVDNRDCNESWGPPTDQMRAVVNRWGQLTI
jgi:hypothetical protein